MNEIKPEIRESVLSYLCSAIAELGFTGAIVIDELSNGAFEMDLSRGRNLLLRSQLTNIQRDYEQQPVLSGLELEEWYEQMVS